jgi:dynein heavy chain
MLNEFERLFKNWSELIENALDEAESEKKDSKDEGPRNELEYWRNRMRKLTGISEQLKSQNCRTVYNCLSEEHNQRTSKDNIHLATSRWRSIELRTTEALNEAKDNVKYLTTLEKFIEPLYEGTPDTIKDTLPALMNSIKMIHTIARYYNTNDRMTGLFHKITNQMILQCKHYILNFKTMQRGDKPDSKTKPEALWKHDEYPPDELILVLQSCRELNQAYQKQYEITKAKLENMPKGKQFEFSPNMIFGKFDLFERRVNKLIELFSTIQ